MSIQKLQEQIRSKKTPLALGLSAPVEQTNAKILKNFTDMYGEGPMAYCETARYMGCQALDAAADKLPAVLLDAESYLRYGMMGYDVLSNLAGIAKNRGMYVILDCRTGNAAAWLSGVSSADGITVNPYIGSDCCAVGEDKSAFAAVRSANPSAGDMQNLMAGDRPLYMAAAEQMCRHGAALLVETGYSLDIKELRKKLDKSAFLLLTNCDMENALPAFDDYGHGALVVDNAIQYAADIPSAVDAAIAETKKWISVL